MNGLDEEFLKELRDMFKVEAEEHVKTIVSGLIVMEQEGVDTVDQETIETVYRETHSLKGAARAVNLEAIESLCQALEDVFVKIKHKKLLPLKEHFTLLHQGLDFLRNLIENPGQSPDEALVESIQAIASDATLKKRPMEEKKEPPSEIGPSANEASAPSPVELDKPLASTIRVNIEKLDTLLNQSEEMVGAKLRVQEIAGKVRKQMIFFDAWRKEWEKKNREITAFKRMLKEMSPSLEPQFVYQINKLVDFLESDYKNVEFWGDKLRRLRKTADTSSRQFGTMVDHLLTDMKKVLMLPFATLFKLFPKIVRDISSVQDKEVQLIVKGGNLEVDRRILEEMKDPFIHLLRNCVDHGIETPEERKAQGKLETGMIQVELNQISGSYVEIIIKDDGRGIDAEKVTATAVSKKLLSKAEADALTEEEKINLIFQSELSTSSMITDISGRGLGLAIVREKIEDLGGSIALETEKGQSTTFRMVLPVTMATFRGILIRVGKRRFIVPTAAVERVMRIQSQEITVIEGREAISYEGAPIALTWLEDVLELQNRSYHQEKKYHQLMVISASSKRIAFVIDEVVTEQEVLVKGLGSQLTRVRNIAGSAIQGSGEVIPVLNVFDLLKSAVRSHRSTVSAGQSQEKKKRILVAEDSITSRTLIKNTLESAGFHVKTTIDGEEAYGEVRSNPYDLVVSDVEMPRMSGFDLVASIRANKEIAHLPVVLVTSLSSPEDRERGIDVGANAYIVKKSFDQSNLIEVVKQLV